MSFDNLESKGITYLSNTKGYTTGKSPDKAERKSAVS